MKSKILILFSIFSLDVFACRPGPLPVCEKSLLSLNHKALLKLKESTEKYQDFLSSHVIVPHNATSCFNNKFGTYYLGQLLEIQKSKSKTCADQLDHVRASISYLIDPLSLENRQVPDGPNRYQLGKLSDLVREDLEVAFPSK